MPSFARKKDVRLGMDLFAFGEDVAAVVVLRVRRIAAGGASGKAEAKLMVSEKVKALALVMHALLTGEYGSTVGSMIKGVAAYYARGIRANRTRLSTARRLR